MEADDVPLLLKGDVHPKKELQPRTPELTEATVEFHRLEIQEEREAEFNLIQV